MYILNNIGSISCKKYGNVTFCNKLGWFTCVLSVVSCFLVSTSLVLLGYCEGLFVLIILRKRKQNSSQWGESLGYNQNTLGVKLLASELWLRVYTRLCLVSLLTEPLFMKIFKKEAEKKAFSLLHFCISREGFLNGSEKRCIYCFPGFCCKCFLLLLARWFKLVKTQLT